MQIAEITKDYHGYSAEDALKDLDQIVMCHKGDCEVTLTIITGMGVINEKLKKYLANVEPLLNISWTVPLNNPGNIIVNLEKI